MELSKNPFFILDKGCGASREAINTAADEKLFFDEDGSVEQAQNTRHKKHQNEVTRFNGRL